jgi:FKBP-type peptidyl-prolyl cis-trans isomerase (trigger factor)
LKYQITTEKNWHTVIEVSCPPVDIASQIKKEFDDHLQTVKIEGFRKGKVPPSLIQKMFGKQIENKICAPYIREAWDQIFKENDFDFLTEPKLEDVKFDPEQGLTFRIDFEIQPKIVVQNLEHMPVDREVYEITEADVQAALENVRQDQAMIYTIDGQAQPDHILVVEIQELDRTGVPIIGRKFDNYEIKLNRDDQELTPQLLGIAVGEQRRITLEPEPSQPSSEILAQGKPKKEDRVQSFNVKVKEIK